MSEKAPEPGGKKKSFEDAVVTTAILIGLGGGVLLLSWDRSGMSTAAAIFFAMALTAFTHRFLGGIDAKTSFTIGTLKVTGTFAVLLGSFWLINNSFTESISNAATTSLPAALQPGNIFFFDRSGDPVSLTFHKTENGDSIPVVFQEIPGNQYKSVERDLAIENGQLFVKTKDAIYLGTIDKSISEVSNLLLTPRQNLSLGMYYSQVTDKNTEPHTRRDPNLALRYLSRVLANKKNDPQYRRDALNQLFFLSPFMKKGTDFELMLSSIQELKHGYHMHYEMASIHLTYANNAADNPTKERKKSLQHYLQSLASRSGKLDQSGNKGTISIVKDLINIYLNRDAFVRQNGKDILKSIDKNDRRKLNHLINGLEASIS